MYLFIDNKGNSAILWITVKMDYKIRRFLSVCAIFNVLFLPLQTQMLNKHLSSLMPGLTAKVFRTYNASVPCSNSWKSSAQWVSCFSASLPLSYFHPPFYQSNYKWTFNIKKTCTTSRCSVMPSVWMHVGTFAKMLEYDANMDCCQSVQNTYIWQLWVHRNIWILLVWQCV